MKTRWLPALGFSVDLPDNMIYTESIGVENIFDEYRNFVFTVMPTMQASDRRDLKRSMRNASSSNFRFIGYFRMFHAKYNKYAFLATKEVIDPVQTFVAGHEETHFLAAIGALHLLDEAYQNNTVFNISPSDMQDEAEKLCNIYPMYSFLLEEKVANLGGIYAIKMRGFDSSSYGSVEEALNQRYINPAVRESSINPEDKERIRNFETAFDMIRKYEALQNDGKHLCA